MKSKEVTQRSPWTETPSDRDPPPGQRPLYRDPPPGQRDPCTETPCTETPFLDRDPPEQRPPRQRPPWTETPRGWHAPNWNAFLFFMIFYCPAFISDRCKWSLNVLKETIYRLNESREM